MFWANKGILRQYLTAFCASLSGICGGSGYMWVTPLLLWFTSPESEIPMTKFESSWVLNAIEVGDLFTPIPAGILVDKLGRKPMLLSIAPVFGATWVVVLTTRSVIVLYVVRFVQGMALGVVYAVLPMYLGEIAGTKIRGSIGIFVQTMWYAGIVYTFIIGTFLEYKGIAIASLIIPIVFFSLFIWFPESPHYLMMRGKEEEAAKALAWLRGEDSVDKVAEELEEIKRFNEQDKENNASWKDILKTPAGRKALLLVEIVIITSLMGGLVTMLTYSSMAFAELSRNTLDPQAYTILMGVILLIVVPLSGLFLDSLGRRPVLLISCAVCFFCLLAAGTYSYLDTHTSVDVSSQVWISFAALIIYLVFIACGIEAVFPVLQGELFPNSTRAVASSVITLSLTIFSLLSLVVYQVVTELYGMYFNLFIFAFFCAFGFFGVFFFLPETKGKTFSEIQQILGEKR